jgi:2-polyprenyl-6-methoxyphenol hydroxylase-like FAD-dependent oxidoreductase
MRVVIVGAGIGGLASAIALGRAGHEVTVLEREDVLAPVGAGIVLAANATRVLGSLGVDAAARGFPLPHMDIDRKSVV